MSPNKKNFVLKFSTLVVMISCFMVILSAHLFASNLKNILTMWGEDVQLTIYLSPLMTDSGRESIESYLKSTEKIGEIHFVSQEKALEDFRAQLASYAPDLGKDQDLLKLIPSSLQVKLSKMIPPSEQMAVITELTSQLRMQEGVDDISFGQEWVEKYGVLVSSIEYTIKIIGFVILLASIFVMSNAIRASVHGRRDEIAILEMIGATSAYIQRPFLFEGALLGASSAGLALALCFVAFQMIKNFLVFKLSFLQLSGCIQFINFTTGFFWILGGAVMGMLGSYICVKNINNGWASIGKNEVTH